MNRKINVQIFNPKAVDRQLLLGHMDMDTREWHDGILTAAARQVVKEASDAWGWVVCDGDVDPEWIEALNSVLDDNRLLTMANGERIQFASNTNFIFETHSLVHASPATVSRMGVIYLTEELLELRVLVDSWYENPEAFFSPARYSVAASKATSRIPPAHPIREWMGKLFWRGVEVWKRTTQAALTLGDNQHPSLNVTPVSLIANVLSQLPLPPPTPTSTTAIIDRKEFVLALVKAFCAGVAEESKAKLSAELMKEFGEAAQSLEIKRPLDCFYDAESKSLKQFEWGDSDDSSHVQQRAGCTTDFVVESPSVKKSMEVLMRWLQRPPSHASTSSTSQPLEPVVVVGDSGVGKNMLLRHCYRLLRSVRVAFVNCSASTSPA